MPSRDNIPKRNTISRNFFVQLAEPSKKNGIWVKTDDLIISTIAQVKEGSSEYSEVVLGSSSFNYISCLIICLCERTEETTELIFNTVFYSDPLMNISSSSEEYDQVGSISFSSIYYFDDMGEKRTDLQIYYGDGTSWNAVPSGYISE